MTTHRIGTTAEGGYIVVEIKLTTQSFDRHTIDHEPITNVQRLSITGEHYHPGDRRGDPSSGGQIVDDLALITVPAPGWSLDEIAELANIWQDWHLNDMQAGCAHQTVIVYESTPYGRRVDLNGTTAANTCPVGYRYGSSWLVKPLTDEVLATIARLDRDRTEDLFRARGYDGSGEAFR